MIFAEISRREALVADVAAAARELEKAAAYPDRCSSNFDCLEGFATVAQTWQGLALELGMEERSIDQFCRELTAALVFLRRLSLLLPWHIRGWLRSRRSRAPHPSLRAPARLCAPTPASVALGRLPPTRDRPIARCD
jgi:hypothetical protein